MSWGELPVLLLPGGEERSQELSVSIIYTVYGGDIWVWVLYTNKGDCSTVCIWGLYM